MCFPEELWEPGLPRGKVSKCAGQEHGAGEEHNKCLEAEKKPSAIQPITVLSDAAAVRCSTLHRGCFAVTAASQR